MRATDHTSLPVRLGFAALVGLAAGPSIAPAQPAAAPSGPRQVVVADVIPQGLQLTPPERVKHLIKTAPGAEYNKATVEEDVRRLYETKLFGNVQVRLQPTEDGRVTVYYDFREYPSTVQEIVYQGAKHVKPDDLDTLTSLRKGAPLNPVANRMAAQAILRRLQEDGRMFASVDLAEGDKPGDSRVVFNITEGPKVKISGIGFQGNTFVSDARLRTQINSSHQFLGLFGGTFNPIVADMDLNRLEEYYKTFGFHDVKVRRELVWDEHSRHVRLVFHVHEGPRYRVNGVQIDGATTLSSDLLLTGCKMAGGEFYDKRKVEADLATIRDTYGNRGYGISAREQAFVTAPGVMTVHYEVQERPPNTVGQIIIVGNEVTKQNVILRQIGVLPGQTLTYPDLRVSERNLARLNIFENNPETGARPTVTVLDPDGENPVKDVLVSVNETQTGSLLFGLGVNSDAGLVGSVVLNERNFDLLRPPSSFEDLLSGRGFRGAGQEFRAEAVPGTQLQRYTVSFREPFLFDSPYSLGLSGYYYNRAFNEYTEGRTGGRVTVGRRLGGPWSGSLTTRIENVDIFDVPYFAPNDFQEVRGNNFQLGLQAAVSRDTRDSYLRATEGSKVDISFEQVFGDYTFPLFSLEANKYWTAYQRADGSGRHVLAARSQLSVAGGNTPVFERFYAGGFRSLRGSEFRGIGPDELGFKTGGTFMWLNSLEYQIPLLANDQLYLVFFLDSGTVERDVEITDYRVAAGTGLRIVVPMLGPVPIALDFGFPIVKAEADRNQVFSFWVGFFN
jgi:outer membrane protein insertion porin family